jgi:hypothetical protein
MTRIFVFGSNLAGRHGKGAALYARKHHGAIYGVGIGEQGNSYAIPTKKTPWTTLSLNEIEAHVKAFICYANLHPELEFDVTPIGCGLAGYKREQIRPFFKNAPSNVHFTKEWDE